MTGELVTRDETQLAFQNFATAAKAVYARITDQVAYVAGTNVTFDTTSQPGKTIISATGGGSGGGGYTTREYSAGAWPARGTTGSVLWWDPTGTAPQPDDYDSGIDVWERADSTTAPVALERLAPDVAALSSGWYAQDSTDQGQMTGGQITLKLTGDKFGAAPVDITPGKQYTYVVYPADGSTGLWYPEIRITGGAGGDRYLYPSGDSMASAQTVAFTAATGETQVYLYMTWSSGTAVMEAASLTERSA